MTFHRSKAPCTGPAGGSDGEVQERMFAMARTSCLGIPPIGTRIVA